MSHILALAQRIKTIETIRKTTHAMRIITMSSLHSLNRAARQFERYAQQVNAVASASGAVSKTAEIVSLPLQKRSLIIALGSQKGLCGTFNTELARFFLRTNSAEVLRSTRGTSVDIVIVGRQLITALEARGVVATSTYPLFSLQTLDALSHELVQMVAAAPEPYDEVVIYAQHSHSMMVQRPRVTRIVPQRNIRVQDGIRYEQELSAIQQRISFISLHSALYGNLLNSLAAEHAARFFSMDNASRNADEMLGQMKLDYNKLRQALITKELNDLVGGTL